MAFDPDAYLAQPNSGSVAFDPDAYLSEGDTFDPDAYLAEKHPLVEIAEASISGIYAGGMEGHQDQRMYAAWKRLDDAAKAHSEARRVFDADGGTQTEWLSNPKTEALENELFDAQNAYESILPKNPDAPAYADFAKKGGTIDQYIQQFGSHPSKQEFVAGEVAAGRQPMPNAWETAGLRLMSLGASTIGEIGKTFAPSIGPEMGQNFNTLAQETDALSQVNRSGAASVGRGIGNFAGLFAGNPSGVPGVLTGAFKAANDARTQVLSSGGSQQQADDAALSAMGHMALYMGVGMGAGKLGSSMAGEGASALRQGAFAAGAQTAANIGTSVATSGGDYGAENLTADILFGLAGGAQAYQGGKAAQAEAVVRSAREAREAVMRPLTPDEARTVATEGVDAIAEQATAPKVPTVAENPFRWTGEDVGARPQIAFKLPDGTIVRDPSAGIHAQAFQNIGIPMGVRVEPGFIIRDEFVPGSQTNPEAVASAKSRIEARLQSQLPPEPSPTGKRDVQHKPSLETIRQEGATPPDPNRELGPGAANIEEFGPQKTIGAKNASVDAQRAERGLPPLMSEARKSDPVTWENTENAIEQNPDMPRSLTERILDGTKKSVTDEEQSALLWRMIDLRNSREMAAERAKDPMYTPEEQAQHLADFEQFEKDLQRTEEADRKIGRQTGAALRIRRLMANEDFTLAAMEARERAAKGEPLTVEETQRIKAEHEEIARLAKEQGKREAQLELEAERKAVEEKIAEVAKYSPGLLERARKWFEEKESKLESGRARLKEIISSGFLKFGSGVDPVKAGKESLEALGILANEALVKLGKKSIEFAEYASDMVAEYGEAVRPYLQRAWGMAQKEWNKSPAKPRPRTPAQAKEQQDSEQTIPGLEAAIKETAGESPTVAGLSKQIKELAREYVKAGADTVEKLETALQKFFEPIIPGVTKAELRNEFSDYGKSKAAPTEPLKVKLSQLRQEAQKLSQLEALEKKLAPLRTGQQRVEQSDRARELTKKVNELKRQLGIVDGDPAKRLRSMLEATEKRLENSIADARYEIAKGERSVKTKTPPPTNEKIELLRQQLKEVRAERDALLGPREMTEAQKIEMRKRALQRQIADTQERIDRGDFEPRKRKPPLDPSKDPELQRLTAERERKQNEFKARVRAAEKATWSKAKKVWEGVKSVADASANLATSLDLSALRQGIFSAVSRPITAAKNIGQMIRAFGSEAAARRSEAEINLRENSRNGRYKAAGLELTPLDETSFTAGEENLGSRLAEKLPGVRPSNRAFKTFLNRMRADMFDALVDSKDAPPTDVELKALGHFVNVATGRGNFGRFQGAIPLLGRIYWSPRLLMSRIQLLIGQPGWGGTGWTRKVVAKEYGRYLAGMAALYGGVMLAQMAGQEDWSVGTDPRSADFGKVVIGNTRIDPLGGLAQVMTLVGRLATGESKDARGKVKEKNAGDVLGSFNRSKLAPAVGTLWDIVSRKQYTGEPTTIGSVARNFFVPLSLRDLPDDIKEEGLAKALAIWVANIFGISTRAYTR